MQFNAVVESNKPALHIYKSLGFKKSWYDTRWFYVERWQLFKYVYLIFVFIIKST